MINRYAIVVFVIVQCGDSIVNKCALFLVIVLQQLQMKNRQLKEIIDQLRTIIWEINTMMTMRRTVPQ